MIRRCLPLLALIGNLVGLALSPAQLPEEVLRNLHVEIGEDDITRSTSAIVGVQMDGAPLPEKQEIQKVLSGYLGQPITQPLVEQIAAAIVDHYSQQGYPVVDVMVPEQEVSGGTIRLSVQIGRWGNIGLEGAEHFSNERLGSQLWIEPGSHIRTAELQNQQGWLENNPFRKVTPEITPGETLQDVGLTWKVTDSMPRRFFGGFENTGTPLIGEERWRAGFHWGDVLNMDHRLSYQAVVGQGPGDMQGHAFAYRVPLSWGHYVEAQGSYVDLDVPIVDTRGASDLRGESWSLGVHYHAPLGSVGSSRRLLNLDLSSAEDIDSGGWRLNQEISFGFEAKGQDNDLIFGGATTGAPTEIYQFTLGYLANMRDPYGAVELKVNLSASPGGLSSRNSDDAFRAFRGDLDSSYVHGGIQLRRIQQLGEFTLILQGEVQWSSDPLLPVEQLSLGGHQSVRGYTEHEALGDSGYRGSLELRSPVISPGAHFSAAQESIRLQDELQLLTFLEFGTVENRAMSESINFSSAGVGLRYRLGEHISVRCDYGWQLKRGPSQIHFGVTTAF